MNPWITHWSLALVKGIREPHEVTKKYFDLGGNRTHDLRIRSTVTLPTELALTSATRQHNHMYPYFLFAAIHHLNRPQLSLSDLVAQTWCWPKDTWTLGTRFDVYLTDPDLPVMRESYELFAQESMQTGWTDQQEIQSTIFQEGKITHYMLKIIEQMISPTSSQYY